MPLNLTPRTAVIAPVRDETSAGGVVYRRIGERIEVTLAEQRDRITAQPTTRLPKGKIDPGETPEEAALREVVEETGLRARVVASLGSTRYVYREASDPVSKEVHFYLMEWIPGEPQPRDGEMERVYWCSIDEAEEKLTFEAEQRAMRKARSQLEGESRAESEGGTEDVAHS